MMENDLKDMREKFMQPLSYGLSVYYSDSKLREDQALALSYPKSISAGIQGEIVEAFVLQQHVEAVHFEVFGMQVNERCVKEVKGDRNIVDWDYYNSFTKHRQRLREGGL